MNNFEEDDRPMPHSLHRLGRPEDYRPPTAQEACNARNDFGHAHGQLPIHDLPLSLFATMPICLENDQCVGGCHCSECGLQMLVTDHGVCDSCGYHLCLQARKWNTTEEEYDLCQCGSFHSGFITLPGIEGSVPYARICKECENLLYPPGDLA